MSKGADGRSSIHRRAAGTGWEGWVSLGADPVTGKRRRKHVRAATKTAVTVKVAALEAQREGGIAPTGRETTLSDWLHRWVESRSLVVRPATISGYEADLKHVAAAGIGAIRLRALTAEHIERLYAQVLGAGCKPGTVAHVRRTVSAAFNAAVKRGYLPHNPVRLVEMPRGEEPEINPYNADEIRAILTAAHARRNGVRWSIALMGLRQGEVLGLTWDDIDLENGTLTVRHALTRPRWQHGCAGSAGKPVCGRPPGYCPARNGGGWRLAEPKTRSGRRTIALPAPVIAELREHRVRQVAERLAAGSLWSCGRGRDFVVAGVRGGPLDQSTDWRDWLEVIAAAGVRRLRIHDLRHSAATALLVMGVDSRTLLAIMGWSSMALAQRYTHLVPELRRQVAETQAALWEGVGGA